MNAAGSIPIWASYLHERKWKVSDFLGGAHFFPMQRKLQQEKFASGWLSTEETECLGFFELTRNNSALSSGPGCCHLQ